MAKFSWLEPLERDMMRLARKEGDAASALMKLRGGERRQVAIMFLDIKGFTAMSEKLDSEEVQLIIDHCFKLFSADIQDFGGEIEKYMGDAIMACFGAHNAHENDAERAVRAAVRILERLQPINDVIAMHSVKIGIRIGVNYGSVTTGRVGLGRDRDFTVMGDTVNTTQRLESNAPVNSVMITKELAELLGDIFTYTPLEPVQVKGKALPLEVCTVDGLSRKRTERWERSLLTERAGYLGRESELAALTDLYQAARDPERHELCIARIEAQAGTGKSRIVHEFLSNQIPPDHELHLHGNTVNYIQVPYEVFSDVLRRSLGYEGNDPEAFLTHLHRFLAAASDDKRKAASAAAPFLASILGVPLEKERIDAMDPKARQLEIQLALAAFLRGAASVCAKDDRSRRSGEGGHYPLILILDDLHWADPLSLSALQFLAQNLAKERMMWILITRPDSVLGTQWPGRLLDLKLPPFTKEVMRQLVESLLPGVNFTEADYDLLHQKTTGLPFFVEEMMNTFVKAGVVAKEEDGRWHLKKPLDAAKMPDSLGGLVKSRIDKMDERSRELLGHGSVVGTQFDSGILNSMNRRLEKDTSDIPPRMAEMVAADFLVPRSADEFAFKSIVVQEVSYERLLIRNRSLLHRLVAEYLEEHGHAAKALQAPLLYHHWSHTEDYEKLFHWLHKALDLAQSNYDLVTGKNLTDAAVGLLDKMEDSEKSRDRRYQVLQRRIFVSNLKGDRTTQEMDILWSLEHARSTADDLKLGASLNNLAELCVLTSKFQDALKALDEVAPRLSTLPPHLQERAHRLRGLVYNQTGRAVESLEAYEMALEIDRREGRPLDEGAIHLNMGLVHANRSAHDKALEHYEKALQLVESVGDRRQRGMVLNNMGIVHKHRMEYSEALAAYKEVYTVFETIGEKNFMAFSLGNMGI
ncbi:MAG: adenylate/guanylate cyclase domain-containing protein, partial [Planctomycetota bacterium]